MAKTENARRRRGHAKKQETIRANTLEIFGRLDGTLLRFCTINGVRAGVLSLNRQINGRDLWVWDGDTVHARVDLSDSEVMSTLSGLDITLNSTEDEAT